MKQLFSSVIYENPLPQLRARQAAFPGLCLLPGGRILAAYQIGEAFESVDGTTHLSYSEDGGKTWTTAAWQPPRAPDVYPWTVEVPANSAETVTICLK